jgi:hypothetical protein
MYYDNPVMIINELRLIYLTSELNNIIIDEIYIANTMDRQGI